LVSLARDGTLPVAILTTLARLLVGYGTALAFGVPLGVLVARSGPAVRRAVSPLLLGASSVPSICWLPLAILWFGLSEGAIQSVVVLGALVPIAMATESAVRHAPPRIEQAARAMGAKGARVLVVVVASALPGILSGAKVGWTFALRALMAAELLFVSGGLGQLLETGRDTGDTAIVLGVVVVLLVLARASEQMLFAPIDRAIARRWGVLT
jgi:NitT/TauT family transport system permease protein